MRESQIANKLTGHQAKWMGKIDMIKNLQPITNDDKLDKVRLNLKNSFPEIKSENLEGRRM